MSIESCRQYFDIFLETMLKVYGPRYLNRHPTVEEMREIVKEYENDGFPGCLGCIDCMHIKWKNCPRALKGLYRNPKDGRGATITCEAWCDASLYCWHWFAGRCSTNNDITVFENSPLLIDILNNERKMRLPEGYKMNGAVRQWIMYFLVDGIYPSYAIFVGPRKDQTSEKDQFMTKRQESRRKDVERLFGCLQGRFRILRNEIFSWSDDAIIQISSVCVILHNLMFSKNSEENEVDENGVNVNCITEYLNENTDEVDVHSGEIADTNNMVEGSRLEELLHHSDVVRNRSRHCELREALTSHLWNVRGRRE